MARKITMNGQSRKSVAEVFEDFIVSQTAQGLYHTKSKEKRVDLPTLCLCFTECK